MDSKQSQTLKKSLYDAVPEEYRPGLDSIYQNIDYDNYSPVKRLENKLGISGIHENYQFPGNMNALEYESLMKPMRVFEMFERGFQGATETEVVAQQCLMAQKGKFLFEIRNMYNELVSLNPELKAAEIKPTQIRSYVAVISGACSGFPAEDIIEFSRATSPEKNDAINDRKRKQSAELERLTGKVHKKGEPPLIENWCPSEKTYNRILAAAGLKSTEQPQPRPKQASSYNYDAYQEFLTSRGYYDD